MKLWLFSSGDFESNYHIDNALMSNFSKDRLNFTFIPSSIESARYCYDEFVKRFSRFKNIQFNMMNIDGFVSENELRKSLGSDLIYLSGGNTYYLLHFIKNTGFENILRQYVERGGVLAGNSAGAIVMTPTINSASYPEEDRDENIVDLDDYTALGLTNFEVYPHYESLDMYDEALREESEKVDYPIYTIPDGAAISVDGEAVEFWDVDWVFYKGRKYSVEEEF